MHMIIYSSSNGDWFYRQEVFNWKKEGRVLFTDSLNKFYLRLYGVIHMVKDHLDSERKPAAATWATLSD